MNLTPEQLEQCRKNFEEWADRQLYNLDRTSAFSDSVYYHGNTENAWQGFQAAWRPIPSVEEIAFVVQQAGEEWLNGPESRRYQISRTDFVAQAIHRKLGGKE